MKLRVVNQQLKRLAPADFISGVLKRRIFAPGACSLILLAAGVASAATAKVDFSSEVRPILAGHCFKCHGPDEVARKAKLRLDIREEALKPAKSGEVAIFPGKMDKSELVARVSSTNEDDIMPPPAMKKPLTPEEKNVLKRWIAQGAEYKPHWAFVAPKQSQLPKVHDKSWPKSPVDHFVLARLEKEGLKPSAPADKYTLVRRVYLDLIGLPPTPMQADAFVKDASPKAYEQLVDGLLDSPHYGERWARRWLDLARYADTNGYEKDRERSIWPWRDWVINALNRDLPFNQFTVEQLAGDLLPGATQDQIIATGLHRNTMLNEEGGIDPLEYRFYAMVDRVHVTSTAWLGLTMACAQCHTHKYDPIQHTEYYRFMACLNNADEPRMDVVNPQIGEKRKELLTRIAALESELPNKFPMESGVTWQIPGAVEFESKNGSEARFLDDGSVRISGTGPETDVYTIKFTPAAQHLTHLQLEALPDDGVVNGGPGRSGSGNFVLSEVKLEVVDAGSERAVRKARFSKAQADFSQDGFKVESAIDGKTNTGWGIAGSPGSSKHRHAIFTLAEPLELKETSTVVVRLIQSYGSHHTLGRFRLSLGHQLADPAFTEQHRHELRDQKCVEWLEKQLPSADNWTQLRPATATATSPTLTVQEDNSIFAGGDFTKNDTYTLKFRNLPAGLKAVRLEMMPDERLPNNGPGSVSYEGPEGDFWLSTFKVKADARSITLTNASESFANGGNNAAKAIDDDLQSGWSVNGGQGKTHNAVFQFTEGVTSTNELQLDLICEKYHAAGLGRFRIWVSTDDHAKASALSNEALAILAGHKDAVWLRGLFTNTNSAADQRAVLLNEFVRLSPAFSGSRRGIENLRGQLPKFPTTLVMQERPVGHERTTFRHNRGDFLQPKEAVTAGVPSFLPPLPENAPKNRLALAQWLVSGANPLTGRVVMNRHWEALFGRGLVRTTEDFGFQGELPSHPELLDWLAVEFVKQGWSQKKMLKLLVMSATYQQSSVVTPELLERDPLNILLTRGPRLRLEAEMVRDSALLASGLLSEKLGGPSVYPPQPSGVTSEGTYGALNWATSTGPDRYRRGLYTFAKRTAPYAMTATFDGPSGEACLARRDRSNTPLQALSLLNDTVFMECARALGQAATGTGGGDEARVEFIFRRCLTRPPSAEEQTRLLRFYQTQLARFASGELKASEILDAGTGDRLNEQAAWTTLARILLNLDETVTKS